MKSLILLFTFSFILASCSCDTDISAGHVHLRCDAEKIEKGLFLCDGDYFKNAKTQSDDFAFSGKYSVKLNDKNPFGFSYEFLGVKKGDIITASVWKKSGAKSGVLAIGGSESEQYEQSANFVETKNGWQKIKCYFIANQDIEKVNVYASNNQPEFAYFDDLEIDYYSGNKKPTDTKEEDILRISIPESAFDSIKMFREIALQQEVITDDLKKYFKGSIVVNGEKIPMKLRLKGDWTDHLETDKWSYRIKISGKNSYQGMKKFSIQNPSTRSYMMEWIAHKLFEQEDVLTTRYSFKTVYVNDKNMGVYAFEEHFDKRLLEHRRRREGPIVKFDESGLWQSYSYLKKTGKGLYGNLPYMESSEIIPFSDNRTKRIPTLRNQFFVAQGLMARYKKLDPEVDEYFELDKLAKYLALYDVINSNHGMIWHNQRNYFNPISNRLEPIAYDCFMDLELLTRRSGVIGMAPRSKSRDNMTLIDGLFQNRELELLYIKYLKKFTADDYITKFFESIQADVAKYESLLQHEYPFYSLDKKFFIDNCSLAKKDIPFYEKHSAANEFLIQDQKKKCVPMPSNLVLDKAALKVYTNYKDSLRVEMAMYNYHTADIEVVAYSTKMNKDSLIKLDKSIKLKAYTNKADRKLFAMNGSPKYFFYKASNTGDSLISYKASKWPEPNYVDVIGKFKDLPVVQNSNGDFVLKAGSYTFSSNVFFPRGRKLIIEPGVTINLVKSAGFISYSGVEMKGSASSKIVVKSTDQTGSGFSILAPGDTSVLSYVNFSNLNTMLKNSWTLTGAVTIYEGEVKLSNCSFADNHCEDGLNLIRCNFDMKSCEVKNTYADGFDADFCTGIVDRCKFTNTGNDCIDFSGSQIAISNCVINGSGDKGISGGENSLLTVKDCKVLNTSIAIASKDYSQVNVSNTSIKNADYAFAAYRKKAEFGPATINAKTMTITGVKSNFLIELKSVVNLEGQENVGNEEFDIDSMYMVFAK